MVSKWWPLGQLTAMSTPQYLSYQCPCPVSESQTLPISWEILQDQQVGLAQAPRKSLLFPLVPVCTRLCVCPPRLMFVSPNPAIEPCWPSKPNIPKAPPSDIRALDWRAWHGVQTSHSCGKTLAK